jgi:hypothetical protein
VDPALKNKRETPKHTQKKNTRAKCLEKVFKNIKESYITKKNEREIWKKIFGSKNLGFLEKM